MKWRLKARLGRILDRLPAGRAIHAQMQLHVLRSLPLPEQEFRDRCAVAFQHVEAIEKATPQADLSALSFFEFGSGWDLTIPQLFWMCGVEKQCTVDLNRLCRPELVYDARRRLTAIGPELAARFHRPLRRLPELNSSLSAYLSSIGIIYDAPADASNTGAPSQTFDVVTSSLVLEHVPEPVIAAIYGEMFRILRPGAVISGSIDMSDHYSHGDRSISPWNFLTLSDGDWASVNGDLLYQNRLRGAEHVALLEGAGFEIVACVPRIVVSPVPFEQVRQKFSSGYRGLPREVAEPTQLHSVARRP